MKITALNLDTFAGLNNREMVFSEGLNVLLGPNEAGKSTVVEAVFATLFRDTQMGKNTKEYKDFIRFMPYPGGKSLRTSLTLTEDSRQYNILKEWGSHPRTELKMEGQLIRDSEQIRKALGRLLKYGEGTYEKIVFAKQKGFQNILERLIGDAEATSTLSGVLRQAVMELDGVSVEDLKNRIDSVYSNLADHWDHVNDRPEGNRGIHNPWKSKIGEVLEQYYRRERLKIQIDEIRVMEERYHRSAQSLKETVARKNDLDKDIVRLSNLESDIVRRGGFETRLQALQKDYNKLKEINAEYPVLVSKQTEQQGTIQQLRSELSTIEKELERSRQIEAVRTEADIIKRAADLDERIAAGQKSVMPVAAFKKDIVEQLNACHQLQGKAEAAIMAAQLQGRYLSGGPQLEVRSGLGEAQKVTPGETFSANGYLKLTIDSKVEIEVASGEIDYQTLIQQQEHAQQQIEEILNRLQVDSIHAALENHALLQERTMQLRSLEGQLQELLDGRDRKQLQNRVDALYGVSARSTAELDPLKYDLTKRLNALENENAQAAQKISQWEKEFGDLQMVVDLLVDKQMDIRETTQQLQKLPDLPDEFTDVESFREELDRLRSEALKAAEELEQLRGEYYQVKGELAKTDSLEELQKEQTDADKSFAQVKERLKNMEQVKKVFYQTLDEMDQNTYEPLIDAFGRYLGILTDGRYSTGEIRDSLEIEITRQDGVNVPTPILSMGTYDCVSLAFRLAVLEHLFKEQQGLLVLDDCLVNMDEVRRKQAAGLIRKFAETNQVIFSTCSPDTAALLGGKVINV